MQRNLIIRLFDENIYPHIIGDLKILDTIQPKTHSNSCAIPTAMLILSSLDILGFLLRDTGQIDKSENNITAALLHKDYFPTTKYQSDIIKSLCIFYRHGMMHGFYPRQTTKKIYGIHKSDGTILLEQLQYNGCNINSLNVNVLSNDFKSFIDKLYDEVSTTQDNHFLENIIRGFKIFTQEELTTSITTTNQTTIPFGVKSNKKLS